MMNKKTTASSSTPSRSAEPEKRREAEGLKEKVLPKTRLSKKTTEQEVLLTIADHGTCQDDAQTDSANAETNRVSGCTGRSSIAKAEPNRPVAPNANFDVKETGFTEEQINALFEPYYHPKAASSDERKGNGMK